MRSDFLEQDSPDFCDEGRLSLLPRLRIFDVRSAIAGRGTLVRISWNKIYLTFVARGYVTRLVFLSCLGTLQKRESWQTKRFSVGIVLTIIPSPNSRRWLLRPYRKWPNKRPASGGASTKAFAGKNASPSMWRLFLLLLWPMFWKSFTADYRRRKEEHTRQPAICPPEPPYNGRSLPLTDPSTCE